MQYAMAFAYWTERGSAFSFWTLGVRAFSFWTQPCQGKWHLDDACHGTVVMLAVKAWNIAANTHVAFTNTQRVPGIVTPVQFYSLYLMYIYICYYHTSRFQHKHPASHPSPLFLTRVALLSVGNKGKLAKTTRRDEPDAMSTTR